MRCNHFYSDLEYSLEGRESELFDTFYQRVFCDISNIEIVDNMAMQRKGIDKVLTFGNGKQVWIDEKKRRKDYGDILLEEYSNFEKKKVGWLGREKQTDYIVYAFMDTGRVYLLPFLLLQKAWLSNYHEWLRNNGRKFAQNKGYKTSNIPVPTKELLEAIKQAGIETLTA